MSRPRVKLARRRSRDGRHTYEEVELIDTLADKAGGEAIAAEAMANAETAASALARDFPELVRAERAALAAAVTTFVDAPTPETAEPLRRLAHELKGQGGSFGYPIVSAAAASLDRLLRGAAMFDRRLAEAARAHADAIALAFDCRRSGPADAEFTHLLARLEAMTEKLAVEPDDPGEL